MKRVKVVGIGNPLLTDEGVGIHAINRLIFMDLPAGIDLVDGGTNTYDLVDVFSDSDYIIIVDALKAGDEPGAIYRASLDDLGLKPSEGSVSLHEINFMEAMHMVRLQGYNPQVVVFGIEPAVIDWGLELSPTLEARMPRLLELVKAELEVVCS
ncbi:MAG: hydrogenase maturation protease [Methylocystaceae bacterium]